MFNLASRLMTAIGSCWNAPKRVVVYVDGDSVSAHHVGIVLNYLRERNAKIMESLAAGKGSEAMALITAPAQDKVAAR